MYLNATTITASPIFSPVPIQFSEVQTGAQQTTTIRYNIINISGQPVAGLIGPGSSLTSNNSVAMNINGLSGSAQLIGQTSSEMSSPSTTAMSSSNSSSMTNADSNSVQLENQLNGVVLREKNFNSTTDSRKSRKRMSDPVYSYGQESLILNPTSYVASKTNSISSGTTGNLTLTRDSSLLSLSRRRSLRMSRIPLVLQTIPQQSSESSGKEPQKLLVVRHAERVDSTFGSGWIDHVFDKTTGFYRRVNLNLPKKMVTRRDLKDFLFDPPITELGCHESKMIGEELLAQGIQIQHVYSSPALRCVQTADKILEGLQMRDRISIRIEPCLFEFLKWYPLVPVKWPFLGLDELNRNGFNVDQSYRPFYPIESLRKDEDESMYYARSHFIVTSILKQHDNDGGNVLVVGHVCRSIFCPSLELNFKFFFDFRLRPSKFALDN